MKKETEQNFYKTLNYYKNKKDKMSDKEKEKYLKVLYPLASKLNIDLRKELTIKSNDFFDSLSNPLNSDEFIIKLLRERYNNCSFDIESMCDIEEVTEFDETPYQKELITEIQDLMPDFSNIEDNTNYHKDHIGNNIFYESKPILKISINTKNNEETYNFINKYIIECLKKQLNYDLYGYINEPCNAHTYLYVSENELFKKIDIIDKLKINDLKKTPLCEATKSFYSIAHLGITNDKQEVYGNFNKFFDEISEVSYYRVMAKLILNIIKIDEDKEIINNFISLKNISFKESNSPLNAIYNKKSFQEIKDIVNRYIPDICNTIKMYIEDDQKILELVSEFRKSMQYISNICQGKDMKANLNIAINNIL